MVLDLHPLICFSRTAPIFYGLLQARALTMILQLLVFREVQGQHLRPTLFFSGRSGF